MRCRSSSLRFRLTALAVLANVLILVAGCRPTPTPPPASFDYLVRVRDSAGATLPNAKVTIEVPGRTPLDDFTDVNGLVVFTIPATYVDRTGKLIAEATGFEIYRQNITLQAGLLPDEIRLSPATVTPPPTESPVATVPGNLSAPTVSPTATNTLTATPAQPTILNLHNGDLAAYRTLLLGKYTAGLDENIRVFVVPPPQADGTPSHLYPQSYNHCKGNDGAEMRDGQWEQHIQVGLPEPEDVGLRFDVVLTTATDAGNAAVVAEIQRWCDDPEKKWPGFAELPAEVDEVARITVIRSAEVSHAPDPSGVQLPGAIRITNLRNGQAITDEEVISGTYSNLPAGHTIWMLVHTAWGKWFLQSSAACDGVHTIAENGQWRVTGNFRGGASNEPYDVVAVVADPAAGAILDQKQREWCAQAQASPDFKWPGMLTIELPPGITEKDRIQVFHAGVVATCAIPTPCEGCVTLHYTRQGDCQLASAGVRGWTCIDEFGLTDFGLQQAMSVSKIRIDMLKRADSRYGYSIWEIEAYGHDAPDANMLPNGGSKAEASTSLGHNVPARAIDGLMPDVPAEQGGGDSRWESIHQEDPQWFVVTLSDAVRARPIDRITLKWEEGSASDYCVTLIPAP
jgi:hypothetical protein